MRVDSASLKQFLHRYPVQSRVNTTIILLACIFLIRAVLFLATQDVGVEHDSGWLLGAAKNAALGGKYASYTNLSSDTEHTIVSTMFDEPNVQDQSGLVYFPTAISVGPGYIVPQAVILKVFGHGYWQYKVVPLIGYFILLCMLLWLAYSLAGIYAVLLLAFWLYAYPQILLSQSFEALSEHISLVYALFSGVVFVKALRSETRSAVRIMAAGVLFGISLLTKSISILFAPAFIAVLWFFVDDQSIVRKFKKSLLFFGQFMVGALYPITMFEVYKFLSMYRRFGVDGYIALYLESFMGYSRHAVSTGLGPVLVKLNVWWALFPFTSLWVWLLLFILSITLFYRKQKTNVEKYMLIILAGAWPMLLWFTLLSPNGWLRHILPSVLMIMLVWVSFAVYYIRRTRVVWMAILCISLFLSVFASVTSTSSRMTFALSKGDHNAQWKKWASGNAMVIQLFYSHPVFSWSDQTQVVDYIRHLPPSKNVFYIGSFYMAEIAALSDRVIGPITRYSVHDGADPIIIFGPYQRGALTRLDPQYHADMQKQLCRKTVLENASYLLCVMKPEYYSSFMK